MAASATRTNVFTIPGGQNGRRVETHTLTFDSDATVEVGTTLSKIEGFSYVLASSAGANVLRLDETVTNNRVNVSSGNITVDCEGTSVDSYLVTLVGY